MSDGWIKIHRKLTKHPIWKNSTPAQKTVLITLICMANHEPNRWEWNGEIFEVKRGQMVTSLNSICEECGKGVTIQNVRTALVRFEKLGFLTNESTKSGRLITIVNYCKWQDSESETNKDANKDLTKTSQRPNKDLTPNKNDKNINTIKDSIRSTEVPHGTVRQKVIDEWNALPLQKLKDIKSGTNRYKMLNARVKEYGLDSILEAISSIRKSKFLLGQNSKGWMITFDWFIRPNNFAKVLEGNYRDKLPTGEESKFEMSDEEVARIVEQHSGADTW